MAGNSKPWNFKKKCAIFHSYAELQKSIFVLDVPERNFSMPSNVKPFHHKASHWVHQGRQERLVSQHWILQFWGRFLVACSYSWKTIRNFTCFIAGIHLRSWIHPFWKYHIPVKFDRSEVNQCFSGPHLWQADEAVFSHKQELLPGRDRDVCTDRCLEAYLFSRLGAGNRHPSFHAYSLLLIPVQISRLDFLCRYRSVCVISSRQHFYL